ncbi:MAG: hypothetical protein U9N50_07480 [Pseudomonadota bacterium]|nr:hypothetical protein [Pseudomonadota bacterium]
MFLKHLQFIFLLALASTAMAETNFGGHVKYFYSYSDFPDDSVFAANANPYRESLGNLRLKAETHSGNWDARLHYELNGLYSTELRNCVFRGGLAGRGCTDLASDQRQLFDLSSVISESDDSVLFHRIDRLVVAYSTEKLVTRAGRQAISWGNGMVYNPLDLFNPFPPDAIDREYKRGEDMLYMQGLFGNGSDLQGLYIPRRNPVSGEVESRQSAMAGKYHWLASNYELDLLAARNYGDTVVGAAYTGEWRENVINASATLTHTNYENYWSVSANYNYSTILQGKNLTGFIELFYNGFGLSGKRHSIEDIFNQQALFSRLLRGELFTIGKYYLATGSLLEVTPLLNLNPILFINLGDGSAMLQFIGTYSLSQNFDFLAGFNLPIGADGTEFGGIEAVSDPGQYLAPANTLFARLAWYF